MNQRLSESYVSAQESYRGAADSYKKLIAVLPDAEEVEQPSIFLQLAFAAQSANDLEQAIAAYRRYLVVAPDSPNAEPRQAAIKQLEAVQKAQAAAQTSQR